MDRTLFTLRFPKGFHCAAPLSLRSKPSEGSPLKIGCCHHTLWVVHYFVLLFSLKQTGPGTQKRLKKYEPGKWPFTQTPRRTAEKNDLCVIYHQEFPLSTTCQGIYFVTFWRYFLGSARLTLYILFCWLFKAITYFKNPVKKSVEVQPEWFGKYGPKAYFWAISQRGCEKRR